MVVQSTFLNGSTRALIRCIDIIFKVTSSSYHTLLFFSFSFSLYLTILLFNVFCC
jgi:hypothetical protein